MYEDFVLERIKLIEKYKKKNIFISTFFEDALKKARELDRKEKKGEKLGKLAGIIVSVKDNIAVKNKKMTCASKILENYVAPYDATVVERLKREDAIIIGKTNMDEFACGSSGETSYFGKTLNAWNDSLVPGGSSSGSAVSCGLEICDASLASDTGGSVRCPAAFNGVFGIKPSYGVVSRYGLADMAMSFDQIGTLSKNPEIAFKVLKVISGRDERDPVSRNISWNFKGDLKFAVIKEFFEGISPKVSKKILNILDFEEVSIPSLKYAIPVYYLVMFSEFSSCMQRYDGFKYGFSGKTPELLGSVKRARSVFGREVKRRILLGCYITLKEYRGKWYTKALKGRELIGYEFKKAFKKYDCLLGPTMPTLPWKFGEKQDPLSMYASDILTVSANLCRIPSISVPVTKHIGLQIMADEFCDGKLEVALEEFT